MSSKRKTTKPTRASEFLSQNDQSETTALSSSLQLSETSELSSGVLSNLAIHETSHNDETSEVSLWQVNPTSSQRHLDLPTMVHVPNTFNGMWPLSSTYINKKSNTVKLNSSNDRNVSIPESNINLSWGLSPDESDLLDESPLTNGEHSDPLMCDSSNCRPPPKKSRKIRYKYQDNSEANVKFKCSMCQYCTNRSDHYKRHLITHSDDKPLKCCNCSYGTGRSDHFKRHLIRHGLSAEEVENQCRINGIKRSRSRNSIGQFGDSDPQMFLVKSSTSRNDSDETVSSVRESSATDVFVLKKFTCEVCSYCTDRSSHYVRHMKTHTIDQPFKCENCGRRFKLDVYLKKHRCPTKKIAMPATSATGEPDDFVVGSSRPPTGNSSATQQNNFTVCTSCGALFQQLPDLISHICPNLVLESNA